MHTIAFYSNGMETCLAEARWLTEEEKKDYNHLYADMIMMVVEHGESLPFIHAVDRPDRKADGEYLGCSNAVYIINEEQRAAYIALNEDRKAEREKKERKEEREYMQRRLESAMRQTKLYTREEAERMCQSWINVVNEGGEGYVPHYYTAEEVKHIQKWLAEHPED